MADIVETALAMQQAALYAPLFAAMAHHHPAAFHGLEERIMAQAFDDHSHRLVGLTLALRPDLRERIVELSERSHDFVDPLLALGVKQDAPWRRLSPSMKAHLARYSRTDKAGAAHTARTWTAALAG